MEDYRFKRSTYMNTYNVDIARRGSLGGILRTFQEAGSLNMNLCKPSYAELLDEGIVLMLSRMDIVVRESPMLEEDVEIQTWASFNDSPVVTKRCYEMYRKGVKIAAASSSWAMVDLEERKLLRTDTVDWSNYNSGPYEELFSGKFRIPKTASEKMQNIAEYRVELRDCDYNGHINNTYYLDILCNYIPELLKNGEYFVDKARIHYAKEAPLGETITIKFAKEADSYFFETYLSGGDKSLSCELGIARI
ncbi:MAG: hypothetical protein GX975_06295 [Clostridiales bacterium]|nr:hypothetical protein [Clostridiales bacterium]